MASEPAGDAAIGDLIAQLVADAQAYARAEADYWRSFAADRARDVAIGAGLAATALVLAQGALIALLVGIILALASRVGAVAATGIVVATTLALAAGLGWLGYARLRALARPSADRVPR